MTINNGDKLSQQQQGGKGKRSTKSQPANQKYLQQRSWEKNKVRKTVNHLYKRVILFCKKYDRTCQVLKKLDARSDVKRDIRVDVYPTVVGEKLIIWTNEHIAHWASTLGCDLTVWEKDCMVLN